EDAVFDKITMSAFEGTPLTIALRTVADAPPPGKNPRAELAPIATRNACQPGTSLRLAVCLVWPRCATTPQNIELIRSLAAIHRRTLLNSRTGKGLQINDKTASGAGHANH